MIEIDINKINEPELQLLIDNDFYREGKRIEYKLSLPSNSKESRIKFLAGISAFANAIGGDYVVGIVAVRGVAKKIEGVKTDDSDKETLRLEQIIRDGIHPRIPSVVIRTIKLKNGNYVFILRIYKSWISPHRVIFNGHDKFYSRNSGGKYPLDVDELRIAFNLTESIKDKIRNFRIERISKISLIETPTPTIEGAKIVLHFIPLESFSSPRDLELNNYFSINKVPIGILGQENRLEWRFNIDGFLTYSIPFEGKSDLYVQISRNGIIEFIDAREFRTNDKKIYSSDFEIGIIEFTALYLNQLKIFNVGLPTFLFMTLLGLKDYSLGVGNIDRMFPKMKKHKIEKNIFTFPEIVVDDFEPQIERRLKPWFDLLWNACGYEKCLHYDENDNYIYEK